MHKAAGLAESLQIDCLESAEAFDQLKAIWQGLERQDTQCTPFNTWVWNHQWWHHYGTAQDRLTLLIARQGNRVVALAPLYIQASRIYKIVPMQVLRFIGTGGDACSDYLNIIALPKCRDAAERAFLDFLPHIKGWHKLHFAHMLQSSSLAARTTDWVNSQPGTVLTSQSQITYKVALPSTFDDYCTQLGQKCRKQIHHRQNCLDAAGMAELSICATNEELIEASDALVSLNCLRRERQQQKDGGVRSTANENFHRAVIRHFFAMDALWLATLTLDGSMIGVQYVFVWRGELIFMQSGDAPEHDSLSPEHILFTYVIQRGIEQGMVGMELLTEHYFCQSADARDQVRTIDLVYFRPGVRRFINGFVNS